MSESNQQTIWPYAQSLREVRGQMSIAKAARLVDVDRQTWTAWEKGTQAPRYERLKDIIEAFGCPPEMIGYEPPQGWELVPAAWIQAQAEQQRLRHDELIAALRGLDISVHATHTAVDDVHRHVLDGFAGRLSDGSA